MKKALAMALGAVLVAGTAAPASATDISVSGFYRAQYFANGNLGFTGEDNLDENFFISRLRLNVNFQATDEVSVHWRFQAPGGRRWGDNDHSNSLQSRFFYGQVVQDWGTIRVGSLPGGAADEFGLSTLGWAPSLTKEVTYIAPFEGSTEYDGIQYSHAWDNGFQMKAAYAKANTLWRSGVARDAGTHSGEHDADRFQVEGAYKWDGGGMALNLMYLRDATGDARGIGTPEWTPSPVLNPSGFTNGEAANRWDKTTVWFLNPAIMHSWGAFSVHAEAKFAFGEHTYHNGNLTSDNANYMKDADASGQGFYLDFDYNYGPGRVNLAGWWVSGNEYGDKDNNAMVDIADGNFYPLAVAYAQVGYATAASFDDNQGVGGGANAITVANDGAWYTNRAATLLSVGATGLTTETPKAILDGMTSINGVAIVDSLNAASTYGAIYSDYSRRSHFANNDANHWALMLSGQHGITDEITLNYALAYLALTNPNYRIMDSLTASGLGGDIRNISFHEQDKDLGWEIDLGVNVQLLDNLAFSSTFGYMFTGDAYKSIKGYNASLNANNELVLDAEWEDADNAYTWLNSLVFSF